MYPNWPFTALPLLTIFFCAGYCLVSGIEHANIGVEIHNLVRFIFAKVGNLPLVFSFPTDIELGDPTSHKHLFEVVVVEFALLLLRTPVTFIARVL